VSRNRQVDFLGAVLMIQENIVHIRPRKRLEDFNPETLKVGKHRVLSLESYPKHFR
jgi:hypothetical protein